jgi:hypothetical protein
MRFVARSTNWRSSYVNRHFRGLGRPGLEPGTNALKERGEIFYGLFLRSGKILLQNGAILRNTAQTALVRITYEKHAMQRYENLRNSLGLNYKSAALDQLS